MTEKLSKLGQAVVGGLVADAASLPLHWHYDVGAMKSLVSKEGKLKSPEFFTPVSTNFYSSKDFPGHYELGQLSCYGEQSVMVLEYLDYAKGKFLAGESFAQYLLQWFNKYDGRQDHPTKEFLEKGNKLFKEKKLLFPTAGADDKQTMFTFKLPVLALKYLEGDEEKFLSVCEDATRAHQNHDMAADFAKAYALMLKNVASGAALADVIQSMVEGKIKVAKSVSSALEFVLEKRTKADLDNDGWDAALQKFGLELSNWVFDKYGGNEDYKAILGLTCDFPGSFIASLKVVLDTLETFTNVDDFKNEGFAFGIRRNIFFGGDNCGRAMVVGPLLVLSGANIPQSCLDKMNQKELATYVGMIDRITKF